MSSFRVAISLALASVAALPGPPTLAQTFVRVRDTGPHVEDVYRAYTGAWGDYDADGDIDLFVGSPEGLFVYRNEGGGVFVAVVGDPADPTPDIPRAPILGDIDNDGDLDVLRATFGDVDSAGALVNPLPNALLRNDGSSFVAVPTSDDSSTSSTSTFVDIDRDGDLDLFVSGQFLTQDLFYRNDPTGFTTLTSLPFLNTSATGATETWVDYDGDGDQDYYVVNHSAPNELWTNLLVETGVPENFVENTTSGLTDEGTILDFAMSWGDHDNDGDLDAFLATVGSDRFFRNDGGTFTRILGIPLVQGGVTSSCGSWGDYDNDGDLDIFTPHAPGFPTPPDLWRNDGGGNFVSVPLAEVGDIVDNLPNPQGSEWADYDGDGDLDLYALTFGVTAAARRNYLFRNDGGSNRWLEIDLVGSVSNRTGVGATIRARAVIGGEATWQMRPVTAGPTSFEFQGPLRAHFGFGATTVVDTVRVEWPSGIVQVLTGVATNQILSVFEADPVSSPEAVSERTAWLGPGSPNPFRAAVSFELRTDARTPPTLAVFDVSGRRLRTLVAARGPGRQAIRWDGRDESGVPAAAGVYFVRATSGNAVGERRVVLLR